MSTSRVFVNVRFGWLFTAILLVAPEAWATCFDAESGCGEIEQAGPITWRSLGVPAEAESLQAGSGSVTAEHLAEYLSERVASGDADSLQNELVDFSGTTRLDEAGGIWVVDQVDWQLFDEQEWLYTKNAQQEPTVRENLYFVDGLDEEDEVGYADFQAWTNGTCPASWALWGAESRVAISPGATLQSWERRSVAIEVPGLGRCSGVLVDPQHVLTNAHCVTNAYGYQVPTNGIVIRAGNSLYDNAASRPVSDIFLDTTPWNGNVRTDYALVRMRTPMTGNGYMLMSNESNSVLEGYPGHNLSYPAATHGSICHTTHPVRLHRQVGAILGVTTHVSGRGLVKTRLDSTMGASGSPIFSCPAGNPQNCMSPQSGTVYGLVSAIWFNGQSVVDVRGPKVPGQLRSWAIGMMP